MQLAEWNEALLTWFFNRHERERVYFRADDADLRRLSDGLQLGLEDPAADLIVAVRDEVRRNPRLSYLHHSGEAWLKRCDPNEAPPWLGLLAVSVLVVARQVEGGSLSFYRQFSEALGTPISQSDYEETVYAWWGSLSKWLIDVNDGTRGLPSWKRLPGFGSPRSVIGHPYTQVLLRREDFRAVDAFLASLGRLKPGDIEVTNQDAAGTDLIHRFRQWATQRRVTPHLWAILHGDQQGAQDSLRYILLDRLLDEVDERGARILEREASLVLTLDAWRDLRLRFSVLVRSLETWVTDTLKIDGETIGPLSPGVPLLTTVTVDTAALESGRTIPTPEDVDVVYRPRDVIALAIRDWDVWCAVEDVEVGERVYLLVASGALERVRGALENLPPARSITDVPEGWALYGPGTLSTMAVEDEASLPFRRRWQSVPQLVGGLEVARRCFLVGGPPAVFVPTDGADKSVRLDGGIVDIAPSEDRLVALDPSTLSPGTHHVDVGPYRLAFDMVDFQGSPMVPDAFGRTPMGEMFPLANAEGVIFCGAIRTPPIDGPPSILVPASRRIVALGESGVAHECSVNSAPWARSIGIPKIAFEPLQRTSYEDGTRPFNPVCWVATQEPSTGDWVLVHVEQSTYPVELKGLSELAINTITSLGPEPRILGHDASANADSVREAWLEYAGQVLGR